MKSNLLRTFFEWALITSVLMSVLFLAWYIVKSREARAYNAQIAQAELHQQNNRNFMTIVQAYARTNAELAKFLAPPAAAAPAPAAPTKGGK